MRFGDIPGQQPIKDRLRKTVHDNRVSHAQLFFGQGGSGKLAMALAYAQYINCSNRTEEDSCGICPSCLQYSKQAHPDLHFLYPIASTKEFDKDPVSTMFLGHWRKMIAKHNGFFTLNEWYEQIGMENKQGLINTADCNDLVRKLSYTSYESEYKIMIIWMVEKIHHQGANKILKILEEPPDKTLFILITEQQELILPTILSRTQLVKFPRYTNDDLKAGLMQITGCNAEQAKNATGLAEGNLTEAIRIVGEGDTENELFIIFRNWMRLCYRDDIVGIQRIADELKDNGREFTKRFFQYALKVCRYCTFNNFKLPNLISAEGEEEEFITKFSPFINPSNVEFFIKEFNEAIYHTERNAHISLMIMDISLKSMKWLKLN